MAAWITIAVSDLNDYLVAAQVNALRSAALGSGQSDPFTNVMQAVTNRVRAKILSCDRNQVSATSYEVPPELKTQTIWLILEAMQSRIPGLKLTDEQKTLVTKAEKDLDDVAACDFAITTPTTPLTPSGVARGNEVELVSSRTRTATPAKLAGL
jgi:hypothetical protein